jgi:hypothetical protein
MSQVMNGRDGGNYGSFAAITGRAICCLEVQ